MKVNAFSFALLELARHPAWQERVRKELRDAQANPKNYIPDSNSDSSSDSELGVLDLDRLPLLNAHIKVSAPVTWRITL